jgi:hypothetical protein
MAPFGSIDAMQRALLLLMRALLILSLVAVVVVGILMIRDMDASSRSQGGVFYVGGAVVFVALMIVGKLVSLRGRGRP